MSRLRRSISAALAETRLRLLTMSRYPAQLPLEIVIPIVLAILPMLLGRAAAGPDAAENFAAHAGTANYVAYLLIGSNVFIIVSRAFWDLAYWLRFEQETGTFEALHLAPAGVLSLAGGVALYSAARSLFAGIAAYLVGCAVFRVDPFSGDLGLALVFLVVGLVPVYALAFLFAAVVLRVKESTRLVTVMQWAVSFLMGVFFPLAMLPPWLRAVALALPPAWMTNGVRSALLGVGYFLDTWYLDLAVLWGFVLIVPLVSVAVFRRTEDRMRRAAGLGQY
jgi:ABC-2 type transport system permease protein